VCKHPLCHSLREYIQANSCSDKRGEGEAHCKSLLSLPLEDLWGSIIFLGCGGCRANPGSGVELSPVLLRPGKYNVFIFSLSLYITLLWLSSNS